MPEANVYILTRPLKNGPEITFLGDGGKHWALILEFLDGSGVYLCEITIDENTDFTTETEPKCSSVSASGNFHRRCEKFVDLEECKEGNTKAKIKYKGRCKTTTKFLKYQVENIDSGKQYHLLNRNCQTFVEKLIIALEVYKKHRRQTKCLQKASNVLLYGIMGVLFVGAVVLIAFIKR